MSTRESNLKLDFAVLLQSSVDNSSYGYEKPDLSVIYRRFLMQLRAMQSQSHSRISLHLGHLATHLLLCSFLWLVIYYFKSNFQIIFQLNNSSFEKSIFRSLLDAKIQISINLLSFSFGHAFSLFYFIFNYFHGFVDF